MDGLRTALLDDPRVAAVEPNHLGRIAAVPTDPSYASTQAAYLDSIRLPEAWDVTTGAGDLVLAVVDSGVSSGHPDLAGRLLPGRDFVDGDDFPEDTLSHGTRVATVAAARANDAGMSGVAWRAKVLPVKVVDDDGFTSTANLAAGIVWAADHGADVINISIGGRPSSLAILDAIRYAQDRDILIVVAAGNSRTYATSFPADADGVLAVGAVDHAGHLAPFSNWGSWVDLVAPGTGILAGVPGGTYAAADGTSFAAPIVSGVALLARARFPHESAAQIAERLTFGARDIGPLGRDLFYGHGLVDAFSAVGGPLPPRPVDARHVLEPDNTPARATTLRISEPIRAVLAPEGDADWFVVDLPTHGGLWFEVTETAPAAINPFEPSLEVYDVGGVEIDLAGATREPGRFRGSNSFFAGRYYLRVGNLARSPSAPYELTVRSPAPGEAVYVTGSADTNQSLWVRDTTPVAGSSDAPIGAEPTIHFVRPLSAALLELDYLIVLTDTSTGRVVPTDRRVSHPNNTEWVTLVPREPLAPGGVYEMSITAGPHGGFGLWHEAFRFAVAPPPPVPVHAGPARSGYWMVAADGAVYGFGDAAHHGQAHTGAAIVDLEPTPTGDGYWTVDSRGVVTAHGDAAFYGDADRTRLAPGEEVTSLSATPTGAGYWLFTDKARVLTLGDAPDLGDLADVALNGPVLDSIPTPTGRGYYMVAADGG
ncbi:MAG: S8 family serine peptidase, partial [Acidimicrobiia bacterium]